MSDDTTEPAKMWVDSYGNGRINIGVQGGPDDDLNDVEDKYHEAVDSAIEQGLADPEDVDDRGIL